MLVKCKKCKVEFNKSASEISRSITGNHFCSRSCSASFNNSAYPKRKKSKAFCKVCNLEINNRRRICGECSEKKSVLNKTIKEATDKWGGHRSTAHSRIRNSARRVAKAIENKCVNCGYDKHVEVCHIKAISSFDDDCLVREVNDINNLIKLCRNCHWELDNGILNIP